MFTVRVNWLEFQLKLTINCVLPILFSCLIFYQFFFMIVWMDTDKNRCLLDQILAYFCTLEDLSLSNHHTNIRIRYFQSILKAMYLVSNILCNLPQCSNWYDFFGFFIGLIVKNLKNRKKAISVFQKQWIKS